MLKKFIGPHEVDVAVLGQDFGTVNSGDKIIIPDTDEFSEVKWPENLWEEEKEDSHSKPEARPTSTRRKVKEDD